MPPVGRQHTRRLRSVLLFMVGILLLGGAIVSVARQDGLGHVLETLADAPPRMLIPIVLLPVLNWILTSATFFVLTRHFGRVGFVEMSALIGSAWLLNHLPMRPGLIGRVAYHRTVNGINVADSVRVLVLTTGCTAVSLAGMLIAVLASRAIPDVAVGAILVAPVVLAAVVAVVAGARAPAETAHPPVWRLAAAIALRGCDMLVWVLRYLLLFQLLGLEISLAGSAAIALSSQLASLSPIQFGLREWVVGLTFAALPAGMLIDPSGAAMVDGVMVDVVNRASEALVVVPIGLIAIAWLWRARRRRPRISLSR